MRLTGFTPVVRKQIQDRAAGGCEIGVACVGGPVEAIHHRRPRGAGGTRRPETNQPGNGVAVCNACHSWAESNRKTALEHGWLVSQHRVPADVPVYRRGEWVLLDDQGSYIAVPEPAGGRVA